MGTELNGMVYFESGVDEVWSHIGKNPKFLVRARVNPYFYHLGVYKPGIPRSGASALPE